MRLDAPCQDLSLQILAHQGGHALGAATTVLVSLWQWLRWLCWRIALVSLRLCLQRRCTPARVGSIALAGRRLLHRVTWARVARRGIVLKTVESLLFVGGLFGCLPLLDVAWKQCQSCQVDQSKHAKPDPQNPRCICRRVPLPHVHTRSGVPCRKSRDAEPENNVHDPGDVEALQAMTNHSKCGLDEEDDEDGKTSLTVLVGEVSTTAFAYFDNNDDESNDDQHSSERLDATVVREPSEEGSTESTDQDTSWDEDEPSDNHQDHVSNDHTVAHVQDAVGFLLGLLIAVGGGGCDGASATGRRRGGSIVWLGQVE